MVDIFYYIGILYIVHKGIDIYKIHFPSSDFALPKDLADLSAMNDAIEKAKVEANKTMPENIVSVFMLIWLILGVIRIDERYYFVLILLIGWSPYLWIVWNIIFNKKKTEEMIEREENSPSKEHETKVVILHTIIYILQIIVVGYILFHHFL